MKDRILDIEILVFFPDQARQFQIASHMLIASSFFYTYYLVFIPIGTSLFVLIGAYLLREVCWLLGASLYSVVLVVCVSINSVMLCT